MNTAEISMMEMSELVHILELNNVPYQSWGTPPVKSIADLLAELRIGESVLETSGDCLVRHIHNAVITVRYKSPETGILQELYEDRQEWDLGTRTVTYRRGMFDGSVSEKTRPGERPMVTAERGLAEELGFTDRHLYQLMPIGVDEQIIGPVKSYGYPGLFDIYNRYLLTCNICPELYRPEGYVEVKGNRKTFFLWRALS